MLACVLFVQEWRIEFEMKRVVGVVVSDGGNLECCVKHKINVGLCFICSRMENRI